MLDRLGVGPGETGLEALGVVEEFLIYLKMVIGAFLWIPRILKFREEALKKLFLFFQMKINLLRSF